MVAVPATQASQRQVGSQLPLRAVGRYAIGVGHLQEEGGMKSPFPGMDPYIEACGYWGDCHNDLLQEIKRALAAALPPKYRVRTGERQVIELVEQEGKKEHAMYPDVGVTGPLARPSAGEGGIAI